MTNTAPHRLSQRELLELLRAAIVRGDSDEALRLIDAWLTFAAQVNAARHRG